MGILKYAYVITRIVQGEPKGIKSVPNLGVYSSKEKAIRHFDAIIANRFKNSHKIQWGQETNLEPHARYFVILQAYISKGDEFEDLRLEKWKLK
jgi:hypothetical protein